MPSLRFQTLFPHCRAKTHQPIPPPSIPSPIPNGTGNSPGLHSFPQRERLAPRLRSPQAFDEKPSGAPSSPISSRGYRRQVEAHVPDSCRNRTNDDGNGLEECRFGNRHSRSGPVLGSGLDSFLSFHTCAPSLVLSRLHRLGIRILVAIAFSLGSMAKSAIAEPVIQCLLSPSLRIYSLPGLCLLNQRFHLSSLRAAAQVLAPPRRHSPPRLRHTWPNYLHRTPRPTNLFHCRTPVYPIAARRARRQQSPAALFPQSRRSLPRLQPAQFAERGLKSHPALLFLDLAHAQ